MYEINKEIPRIPESLIMGFKNLATPTVADAMGRYNCMHSRIKPVFSGARICGPAVTVNTYMADNLMIHVAVRLARPGDIIVVTTGECMEAGYWGELLSLCAKDHNLGGLVIDGGVRDSEQLKKVGFPVFAANICPRGTFKKDPGSVNVPISCGNVNVNPGDIILGDSDGVIVVPRERAQEVLEAAKKIEEKEMAIQKQIEMGEYLFDILELRKQVSIPD